MTVTIEIDADTAATLAAEAARRHERLETIAADALRAYQPTRSKVSLDELRNMNRQERVQAILGSSSHLGPGRLSEFKEAERALEERRWTQ